MANTWIAFKMSSVDIALLPVMDMMLSGRSHIMVCSLLLWMLRVDAAASAAVDGAGDEPRLLVTYSYSDCLLDRRIVQPTR